MGYYICVEPGVNIFVEDVNPGGKETILFIHGWPADHTMFEYQFSALIKQGFRCVGMDMRGFGKSDKPAHGYDYDRLADDLRCVIAALQLQNITLTGHSTGGAVVIRYVARHQGYGVAKLGLFAAAAPSVIQRPYFPYGIPKEAVDQIIQGTYNDRPKMLADFTNIFFFQHITEPFSDWFFQMGLKAANWSTAAVANTWLDEEELFTDLGKIAVPTLIMHGIHDQVCRFPLAEAQHQGIIGSKLIPFEDCGHALFWEGRDRFNLELARFARE